MVLFISVLCRGIESYRGAIIFQMLTPISLPPDFRCGTYLGDPHLTSSQFASRVLINGYLLSGHIDEPCRCFLIHLFPAIQITKSHWRSKSFLAQQKVGH